MFYGMRRRLKSFTPICFKLIAFSKCYSFDFKTFSCKSISPFSVDGFYVNGNIRKVLKNLVNLISLKIFSRKKRVSARGATLTI